MNEDETIIQSGLFKGKKIELASTAGIQLFEDIAEEFMFRLFGFEAASKVRPVIRASVFDLSCLDKGKCDPTPGIINPCQTASNLP